MIDISQNWSSWGELHGIFIDIRKFTLIENFKVYLYCYRESDIMNKITGKGCKNSLFAGFILASTFGDIMDGLFEHEPVMLWVQILAPVMAVYDVFVHLKLLWACYLRSINCERCIILTSFSLEYFQDIIST